MPRRNTRQQASRGSLNADWTGIPALIDEAGQAHVLTGPPQLVGDVLYVTVAPTAEAPRILAATPLIDLHLLTFDQLPDEIAAALRGAG